MNKVPRSQVAAIIGARSLEDVPAAELANEIAAYLLAERRTSQLESLLRDILEYRAGHGIVEVQATYAHELDDTIRRDIKAQVQELYPAAKTIIISEHLDASVIGGIRLELANQQFEASVRSKLNHFKQLTAVGKD